MKKVIITGTILILVVGSLAAFDLAFRASGGFSLGMDKETYGTEVHASGLDYDQYSNYFVGHGQGLRGLGELEITFADKFAIGLGAGYLGNIVETHIWNHIGTNPGTDGWITTSFIPVSLTLKGLVPLGPFCFSFGAGPSFGFLPTIRISDQESSGAGEENWELEIECKAGLGYHGIVGVTLPLGEHFSLYFQVRGEQLTFKPEKAVILSYERDGVDYLMTDYPDVWDRETIYVDDLSEYLNNPIDTDSPRQALAYNISADSLTFTLGVSIKLF
jgi:hypothetical protein